jgi:transposase
MEIKREHIILTKQEYEQLLQTIAKLEATIKSQQEIINKQQEIIKNKKKIYNSTFEDIKNIGRKKKRKSIRSLEVFIQDKEKVLRFIHNKDTLFDNNIAGRDLRIVKLKQKVSGCFRTVQGEKIFCRIRSYISTIRKQGYSVLDSIV